MLRCLKEERGASDASMALYAFGAAIAISIIVTLRGCIMEYKDARQDRLMSRSEIKKVTGIGVVRQPGGYTIKYDNL